MKVTLQYVVEMADAREEDVRQLEETMSNCLYTLKQWQPVEILLALDPKAVKNLTADYWKPRSGTGSKASTGSKS